MATCEVCGNDYDVAMTIEKDGATHVFDSFGCAIDALAPTCDSGVEGGADRAA
jgi:hypothetical protein